MAKSMVTLMPGEEAKVILEGNMYATTAGLIRNVILFVIAIIHTILGVKVKGILTVTNRRIIVERYRKIFWCFEKGRVVETIMPNAVASVNFEYNSLCCCICKKWRFVITSSDGWSAGFVIKGGYEEAAAITNLTVETLFGNK